MSADLTDVAAYASNRAAEQVQQKAQVSVLKKQNDQVETVVNELLKGIRAPEQTGQNLNIVA